MDWKPSKNQTFDVRNLTIPSKTFVYMRILWRHALGPKASFFYPTKFRANCLEVLHLQICLESLESSSSIPDVVSKAVKGSHAPKPTSLTLLSHRSAASFSLKANGFGRPFLQSLSQQHVKDISLDVFIVAIVHSAVFYSDINFRNNMLCLPLKGEERNGLAT
jgi:hypothetical protein